MALTQVKTSGIADDAVTQDKVANDAIDITELKAGVDGKIISYDASGDPTAVGPGTDGQVLTSTGAGSPPAFEDAAASGAALTGSTDNQVVTVTGANAITGESGLTFDGTHLSITDGDLKIATAGHGIDFSATSGSGTSELFDDYEEGTMTLGLTGTSGAPTAGVQNSSVGYYTKIGNSVHCTVKFENANMSGVSGTIELTGLPFTVADTGHHHVIPIEMVHSVNWSSGDKHVFYTTSNGTNAKGLKSIGNSGWSTWSSGDWAATINYYTDFYFRTNS